MLYVENTVSGRKKDKPDDGACAGNKIRCFDGDEANDGDRNRR